MATFSVSELLSHVFSYVAPPFPAAPEQIGTQLLNRIPFQGLFTSNQSHFAQVELQSDGLQPFRLPIDPLLSISGGNIITSRYAERDSTKGSYKEYWQQKDSTLSVKGVLIGDDQAQLHKQLNTLTSFLIKGAITINSNALEGLNVSKFVVKNWAFPTTPGIVNQAYSFTAITDELDYKLFEDVAPHT